MKASPYSPATSFLGLWKAGAGLAAGNLLVPPNKLRSWSGVGVAWRVMR
jgi:hypothetical protein